MERKSRRTEHEEGKGPVRALLMIALFLALLIVVQIGVIYTRSRRASNDAEALLSAIRMEQAEHAAQPERNGEPESARSAVPPEAPAGTDAQESVPPEEAPAAEEAEWVPPPEDEDSLSLITGSAAA